MFPTHVFAVSITIALGLGTSQDGDKAQDSPAPIDSEVLALFDYDRGADLDIRDEGFESFDGFDRIDLTYASPGGGRVPAYLYMPLDEKPKAGLLLMHGMPGSRENGQRIAAQYVQAGCVVLAISAPWARTSNQEPISFTPADRANQIQLIQDLRRGVDLLLTLPRVDRERIGYVGGSYGGAMGGLLAGVEHRIKAFVLNVGDGGLLAHMTTPGDEIPPEGVTTEQWERWVRDMDPIEPIHFVAHASPSHLLFQNGRTDRLVPEVDGAAYQAAGSEPKTLMWYPDGHGLTPQRLWDQAHWLEKRIGIDAAQFALPGKPAGF